MRIQIPKDFEEVCVLEGGKSYEWVQWYMNCLDWKCPNCGSKMFGRLKYCVYCKLRLKIDTPRPASYVEPGEM